MNNAIYIDIFKTSIEKRDILSILKYSNDDIVFLSGSVIEGIGNLYSDLDIFIIADDFGAFDKSEYDYNLKNFSTQFKKLYDKVNCDIEHWPKNTLLSIIKQVNEVDIDNIEVRTMNQVSIDGLSFTEISSFVHRFLSGIAIYNNEQFESLKGSFDKAKFCKLVARQYINIADNMYIDVLGNLEKGCFETALMNSREMLLEALMGYIFSWNTTIDRKKWIFIKLCELSSNNTEVIEVLNEFKRIYFGTSLYTDADFKQNALETIDFVNRIVELIEIRSGGI